MEVEMKIRGLMMDPVTNMPIVILKDVSGASVLPIWVGVYEANAIALEIEGEAKLARLAAALEPGPEEAMPIRAVLRRATDRLTVFSAKQA